MSTTSRLRPPAFAVGAVALPRHLSSSTGWWVFAGVAILVNAVITGFVAFTPTAPVFAFDEIHHLLMARMVAGFPAPDGSGAGYYPGWGVLLAPLWWILGDPQAVYGAALAVGWLVGVATILPLALLVRRVRLPLPHALVVAAVVSTLPARVAQADNVFSERLLFLCVVLTALAAFRLWERPSHLRAALFALAVAATYFTHIRMLTLVLASMVWAVAFLLKNWRVGITAIVTLVIGYLGADRLGGFLDEALRRTPGGRGENFLNTISDTSPGLLARTILGQIWTQIIGSYGLFAIGVVVLVIWCLRELRHGRLGRATWLAGTLTATFAVSLLTWALDKRLYADVARLDAWTYGRYVEPVTALVCALALAVLVRRMRTRVWVWTFVFVAVITVPTLLWLAPRAPTWGSVTPAHIGGLMPWAWALPEERFPEGSHIIPTFTNENSFWLWASVSAVGALIAILVVQRVSWAAAAIILALSTVGAFGVDAASNDYRAHAPEWTQFATLRAVTTEFGPLEAAYDYNCPRTGRASGVGMNQYSFALLPEVNLTPYFRGEPIPADAEFVLSCVGSPDLTALGARPLVGSLIYQSEAWILPGPLFDELEARGLLAELD